MAVYHGERRPVTWPIPLEMVETPASARGDQKDGCLPWREVNEVYLQPLQDIGK